ncbi:MAG: dihydrodipicolinate synthase family protein [Verrucomicrobiota bacterium]
MTSPLRGIVPPLITPLSGRDTLDVPGLERLIEHLIEGRVAGIFALGTTGEAPSLSHRLRRELVQHTLRCVAGRVPVLVGITDTSLDESVRLAREVADMGADGLVTSAPFYFPAGPPELREYLEDLLSEVPLPVMLYNMPSLTKTSFHRDVVVWAMDQEKVSGIKDSSGDLIYFKKLLHLALSQRPDWPLLVGPEEILAEAVLAGGHGGVSGGANLHPQLYVELYESAVSGDLQKTRILSDEVLSLSHAIYSVGKHGSSIIKGLKCSLSLLGICDDFMAAPFHRFRDEERAVISDHLHSLGLQPS